MNEQGDPRGDAFLRSGLPAEGPAPTWMDDIIGGRLIAALIEPAGDLRPDAAFAECEEVAPGRWAVASAIGSDDDIRRFVTAVRRAALGGRAGIAVSAGALGASGPLGDAPHDALRLCDALVGRRGLLVDPIVHAAAGGPATLHADGRLLTDRPAPRWGRWGAAVAAAAVLFIAGLQLLQPASDPGRIFIFGQPATERSADTRRAFESIQVTIDGATGQFATLIVQDVDGRFTLPVARAVNRQLTAEKRTLRAQFDSDGRPGTTTFLAAFSAEPINDLPARVEALNALGGTIDSLRDRLGDARVVVAEPIEHRR